MLKANCSASRQDNLTVKTDYCHFTEFFSGCDGY